MGNITGKTEKSGTVGAFDKAGNVDTTCILLGDVDPTAEKLYRSDLKKLIHLFFHTFLVTHMYALTRFLSHRCSHTFIPMRMYLVKDVLLRCIFHFRR